MEYRRLGKTELKVSRLGIGLAGISRQQQLQKRFDAGLVLNTALDNGINFLDTAACYGDTEELIGEAVSHRRGEYVLATKAGHVVGGAAGEPWTRATIEASIDRSLIRLKTDFVDILQLHSPTLEEIQRGDMVEAVVRARDAGKTRFIGFSGDNESADWAVDSGHFASLQTSFNLLDQKARGGLLQKAASADLGIIIKRPVANGVWGKTESPYGYADEYFPRWEVMRNMGPLPEPPTDPQHIAMAFVLAQIEVDTVIIGTHDPSHVISNIEFMGSDTPNASVPFMQELYKRFDIAGTNWEQML